MAEQQRQSAQGQPEIAAQAQADVPHLEAEEQRLEQEVERLRTNLVATEAEHERVKAALMRARRAAITGEPIGPRDGELTE